MERGASHASWMGYLIVSQPCHCSQLTAHAHAHAVTAVEALSLGEAEGARLRAALDALPDTSNLLSTLEAACLTWSSTVCRVSFSLDGQGRHPLAIQTGVLPISGTPGTG